MINGDIVLQLLSFSDGRGRWLVGQVETSVLSSEALLPALGSPSFPSACQRLIVTRKITCACVYNEKFYLWIFLKQHVVATTGPPLKEARRNLIVNVNIIGQPQT